jgi:CO/xanthine dehydrogenase Mo-binding subunit
VDLIGSSKIRVDAWARVSGAARYVDDLPSQGMWHGGTVRSPVPRGRLRSIHFDPAFDWSEVTVATARDLPGPNAVAMIRDDHPILADREVRFAFEPVALIAAPDRETLEAAMMAVRVEIDEEPPVLTIEASLKQNIIIWGEDNTISEYRIRDGDLAAGLAQADRVIEGTYRTGHQEHLYLEPNGMIAIPREDGVIEVVGSLQCPYYIHRALANGLGLAPDQVVVRQAATGGAFGGKEDFPSVLALHASVLALRAGHPVKMVYERSEDIRSTTKRHPSLVRCRTGVMNDGHLVATEIDLVLDGGAYTTLSPVVLSRSILHATGAYRIPNVSIRGRVVATNTAPNGAFRGFGTPQSIFAAERQMDRIAAELGIDPYDLRRKNILRDGDRLPFGQILKGTVGASLVLERTAELSGYRKKRESLPTDRDERTQRGIGLSLYFHGGGFTGEGEERIAGKVAVRFDEGGMLEILTSNVEMGQGASTVLCMIAAQALNVPIEKVRHVDPDTSIVPNSGPTVASRTVMIVGRILIDACNDLLARLQQGQSGRSDQETGEDSHLGGDAFLKAASRFVKENGPLRGEATYSPPPGQRWDEETYRGDAYKAYSWGADVVEVEVDRETHEVRPVKVTVVVEIGRAINPVLAVGQVEGGTLQALGYGYMEEIKLAKGQYLNDRMTTYIIPTSLDVSDFEVEIAEIPYEHGPFGAKGLGELPMDGGAPALVAAIDHATGLFTTEIPMTPEKILEENDADRSDG